LGADKEACRAVFERFAERGGNFIDTANNYTGGTSEELVGEFVSSDREYFVLGTKYSLTTHPADPNGGGNHRKSMLRSLEASLRRLRTDYIDVYWLHVWDFLTPVDEVLRAMDDVVRAGKVLYFGISDVPAWIVAHAHGLAELRGWPSFAGLQAALPYCSIRYDQPSVNARSGHPTHDTGTTTTHGVVDARRTAPTFGDPLPERPSLDVLTAALRTDGGTA
jgi:aryl-alcohol dehydrogenase-like predicted oxidoreductase